MITKKDMTNLEGLMMLLAVEENAGKRKAASTLDTSIDTISKYIEYFEEELGVKLLKSNGRGSTLTPEAGELIQYARDIRDSLGALYRIRNYNENVCGEVRLGLDFGITAMLPMDNMGDFFDEYPDVNITISSVLPESLKKVDFDVMISGEIPKGDGIILLATKKVKCGYFASPRYLQKHGYPHDEADMMSHHRMVIKTEALGSFNFHKVPAKSCSCFTLTSNTLVLASGAVKNHVGIGLLPLRFKDEGLIVLDNIKSEAMITLNLMGNRETYEVPRVRAVIDYCRNLLESL